MTKQKCLQGSHILLSVDGTQSTSWNISILGKIILETFLIKVFANKPTLPIIS